MIARLEARRHPRPDGRVLHDRPRHQPRPRQAVSVRRRDARAARRARAGYRGRQVARRSGRAHRPGSHVARPGRHRDSRWDARPERAGRRLSHARGRVCRPRSLRRDGRPHPRVRTERYKYIRNYLPSRPLLQPNRYKDGKPIVQRLRELHAAGKLDELQERLLFSPTRPAEELYDLAADPHELNNLADDPAHGAALDALRQRLAAWEQDTGDLGRVSRERGDVRQRHGCLSRQRPGRARPNRPRARAQHRADETLG